MTPSWHDKLLGGFKRTSDRLIGNLAGLGTGSHLYNPVPRRHGVLVAGAPDIVERLRSLAALAA